MSLDEVDPVRIHLPTHTLCGYRLKYTLANTFFGSMGKKPYVLSSFIVVRNQAIEILPSIEDNIGSHDIQITAHAENGKKHKYPCFQVIINPSEGRSLESFSQNQNLAEEV
jgi:hypothetical protein